MAIELGQAYLTILPSTRGFAPALNRQISGDMSKAGQRAGRDYAGGMESGTSSRMGALGGMLKAGLIGAALTAGVAAGGALMKGIRGASDLEQSVGGVQAVFKEYAGQIEESSKRAATSLGLSRNEYNELATVVGAGLKNKGIVDYANETERLMGLGADLAAQYGGSTKDAMEAISSLMRGEADPIERYGVAINETAVSAELAARGQDKLTGTALETAKAQARLKVLFDQTKDAHGAYSRESETFAVKQQQAAKQWEDLQAKIGGFFLPVLSEVMGFISSKAIPGMEALTGAISDIWGKSGAAELPGKFKTAFDDVWSILTRGDYKGGLSAAFGIEEDSPLVGALFRIRDVFLNLRDTLAPIFDMIRDKFGAFVDDQGPRFAGIWETMVNSSAASIEIFSTYVDAIRRGIEWLFASGVIETGIDSIIGAFGGLVQMFEGLGGILEGALQTVSAVMKGDWDAAWAGMETTASGSMTTIEGLLNGWKDMLTPFLEPVGIAWQATWDTYLKPVWDQIKGAWDATVKPVWDGLKTAWDTQIKPTLDELGAHWQTAWQTQIKPAWDELKTTWDTSLKTAWTDIRNVWNNDLKPALDQLRTSWDQLWNQTLKPIWDDFKSKWDNDLKPPMEAVERTANEFSGNKGGSGSGPKWGSAWTVISGIFKVAIDLIIGTIQAFLTVLQVFVTALSLMQQTWTTIWNEVKRHGEAVMSGLTRFTEGFVAGMTRLWDGLREAAARPVRFVVNTVYNDGIRAGFNRVASAFGMDPLPRVDVAFARGGILPGYTPGRDPYTFIEPRHGLSIGLSGGEAVMRPEFARLLGEKGIELLNMAARKGKGALGGAFDALGHFAPGGIISFRGHRFTSTFANRIMAAERMVGRPMSITQGGWRPATSYSGTSHAGDALDIAGAYHAFIAALRAVGIATWDRAGKGNWIAHAHGVPLPGAGIPGGSAVWQAQDYLRGGDGLGGRDNGPRVGIGANIQGLLDALGSLGDQAWGFFEDIVGSLKSMFKEHLDKLGQAGDSPWAKLMAAIARKFSDDLAEKAKDKIPGFARGGTMPWSGPAFLSEDGRPELVVGPQAGWLRAGTRVFNPEETAAMMTGGGLTVNQHIYNPVGVPAIEEMREASRELAAMALVV